MHTMNQELKREIQELNEQNRKASILERAKVIASQKNTIVRKMHNLWLVRSSNPKTPEIVYDVCFEYALDCFTCTCPHYEHTSEICKHIVSAALYEGGVHK